MISFSLYEFWRLVEMGLSQQDLSYHNCFSNSSFNKLDSKYQNFIFFSKFHFNETDSS